MTWHVQTPRITKQTYFDDISVGTELPNRVVGPVDSCDTVRFCSAWETYGALHTDYKWCTANGYRDVVLNGPLKNAILISYVDQWVGEGGYLKKLMCQHRGWDYHDAVFTGFGKVTRTYEDGGLLCADLEVGLRNERDEISCPGTATVVLPRRGGPPAPIEYPLSDWGKKVVSNLANARPGPARSRRGEGGEGGGASAPAPTGGNMIPDEAKAVIGTKGEPVSWPFPLDRSTVRRFGQATYEEKPIYADIEYARNSRWGELCAPPICVIRAPFDDEGLMGEAAAPPVPIPGARGGGNGGNESEWFRPVKLGDTITQHAYLADLVQRTGRAQTIIIVRAETVYTNQRSEVVAVGRQDTLRLIPTPRS
ncbi:MAG: MaoC family dehydratase N-terminal domain-containing protein [Chloroflexi bacterium]|nr:MaoC family dehydratase N-terminal domain-containing protein [Chloroflexota bacterium]